jgi:hypothetical protein
VVTRQCRKVALRIRINQIVKGKVKFGSAVRDLGCSIEFFMGYMEAKFKEGMNWDNHGIRGWHIDHITPLCSFDLTDKKEFLNAVHYTNLQPLWWYENLNKSKTLLKIA